MRYDQLWQNKKSTKKIKWQEHMIISEYKVYKLCRDISEPKVSIIPTLSLSQGGSTKTLAISTYI